jgi:hypothetical protein
VTQGRVHRRSIGEITEALLVPAAENTVLSLQLSTSFG